VDVAVTSLTAVANQLKAGKVRVLGVTSPRRLAGEMAPFPTWKELGADVDFSNYRGFIGAPGLGAAQVAYWEAVLAGVDRDEGWRAYLENNQLSRQLMSGRDARKYMDDLAGPLKAVLGDLGMLK
jgi:putative tricarboxylic transport membrane protein